MDENDEVDIDRCDEILSMIKKAVRRRILEIKDDIIRKYEIKPVNIRKIDRIVNMTKLYHPIETNKLNLVVQQND
jgi:PHP family Zn ribbon phosphoesterase